MLLAGFVILAHTVIPHHHLNDDLFLRYDNLSEQVNGHAHSDDFDCLITNKLFVDKSTQFKIKKQQQVKLFLFIAETEKQKTHIISGIEYFREDFSCSNSAVYILTESPLRAPPAAQV